ncbi:MAG: hypothetical protein LBV79_00370, partial [Candidatus Adiutrix sp.]|nr:hypothetical protein [Candidatus Adiutrix sp.]
VQPVFPCQKGGLFPQGPELGRPLPGGFNRSPGPFLSRQLYRPKQPHQRRQQPNSKQPTVPHKPFPPKPAKPGSGVSRPLFVYFYRIEYDYIFNIEKNSHVYSTPTTTICNFQTVYFYSTFVPHKAILFLQLPPSKKTKPFLDISE